MSHLHLVIPGLLDPAWLQRADRTIAPALLRLLKPGRYPAPGIEGRCYGPSVDTTDDWPVAAFARLSGRY
ncbi:MAG: hypothetical protein R3F37_01615 [Candidatus Competibacteraceae bacterium]